VRVPGKPRCSGEKPMLGERKTRQIGSVGGQAIEHRLENPPLRRRASVPRGRWGTVLLDLPRTPDPRAAWGALRPFATKGR